MIGWKAQLMKINIFSPFGNRDIMDFATIGGLIIGIGAVIFYFIIEGRPMSAKLQTPAMINLIFGTN